ncbi:MAG: hypothetical protein JHC30_05870 [Caldisericum sp.]|nr:hypothetical protein [Caldisericum sp.]
MFDTAPFDTIKYDTPRGVIQLLQSYINSSSTISALISFIKSLSSTINSATQISPLLGIRKSLIAIVQSSTSFISDLVIAGKQFLNAVISTSTTFISNLTKQYTLSSVLSGKTQITSFISIQKALQCSIIGQTIFIAVPTFWNRVKKLTATWRQKNEEVGTWRRIK